MSKDDVFLTRSAAAVPAMDGVGERTALDRLSRLQSAQSLHAATLALLVPPGSDAMAQAWAAETQHIDHALDLRADAAALSLRSRLPCMEQLLGRLGRCTHADRRAFLEAARRVVSAQQQRGLPARPIDRLHWLLMRHKLGERPPEPHRDAHGDLSQLSLATRLGLVNVTAFLSRLVPADESSGVPPALRQAWFMRCRKPRPCPGCCGPCSCVPGWRPPPDMAGRGCRMPRPRPCACAPSCWMFPCHPAWPGSSTK
jgi:hypothetical protein